MEQVWKKVPTSSTRDHGGSRVRMGVRWQPRDAGQAEQRSVKAGPTRTPCATNTTVDQRGDRGAAKLKSKGGEKREVPGREPPG